jgi:hypothetical protein
VSGEVARFQEPRTKFQEENQEPNFKKVFGDWFFGIGSWFFLKVGIWFFGIWFFDYGFMQIPSGSSWRRRLHALPSGHLQ